MLSMPASAADIAIHKLVNVCPGNGALGLPTIHGQVSAYETIGLARKVAFESVMRMALLGRGERISAQRAYDIGMISEIVDPPGQLRERAQALAELIAQNDPTTLRAAKRALWGAVETGLTDAYKSSAHGVTAGGEN